MSHELGEQLHLSKAAQLVEEVAPVQNSTGDGLLVKPHNGFWTSTWNEQAYSSSWVDWCRSEYLAPIVDTHWFVLAPRPDARIATIDTHADLRALLKHYRRQFSGRLSRLNEFPYLDFEKMSQEYDALHLTEEGQWRTRLTLEHLYGWDCESTVWFRWCFTAVREIEPVAIAD